MYIVFSIIVITAPPFGALVGGALTTKYLGSYTNPKALTLSFVIYCAFMGFCVPCPLVDNYIAFLTLMWLAVFMQGFIEPIMMGIILNTVLPPERPVACSLSILIEMLFGMMPAPYVYGLVQDATFIKGPTGDNISRGGMYTVFFSPWVGGICLLLAILLRNRSYKKSL